MKFFGDYSQCVLVINPFTANALFCYPLKTSENGKVNNLTIGYFFTYLWSTHIATLLMIYLFNCFIHWTTQPNMNFSWKLLSIVLSKFLLLFFCFSGNKNENSRARLNLKCDPIWELSLHFSNKLLCCHVWSTRTATLLITYSFNCL